MLCDRFDMVIRAVSALDRPAYAIDKDHVTHRSTAISGLSYM